MDGSVAEEALGEDPLALVRSLLPDEQVPGDMDAAALHLLGRLLQEVKGMRTTLDRHHDAIFGNGRAGLIQNVERLRTIVLILAAGMFGTGVGAGKLFGW